MEQSHFSIDDMQSYTPNEVTKVDGEQCMGRCISTESFSMTAVPSHLPHSINKDNEGFAPIVTEHTGT